jgi:hypothetical protein
VFVVDEHQHRVVAAIIARLGARTDEQAGAFHEALARHCWPGDGADRREPAALDWVRRWSPRPGLVPVRACTCAAGRCGVCN